MAGTTTAERRRNSSSSITPEATRFGVVTAGAAADDDDDVESSEAGPRRQQQPQQRRRWGLKAGCSEPWAGAAAGAALFVTGFFLPSPRYPRGDPRGGSMLVAAVEQPASLFGVFVNPLLLRPQQLPRQPPIPVAVAAAAVTPGPNFAEQRHFSGSYVTW